MPLSQIRARRHPSPCSPWCFLAHAMCIRHTRPPAARDRCVSVCGVCLVEWRGISCVYRVIAGAAGGPRGGAGVHASIVACRYGRLPPSDVDHVS